MPIANTILTGMVSTQAHISLAPTPHLTAVTLLVIPAPIMAPVIVCVVLTGIPKASVPKSNIAPDVSAATPWKGVSLVMLDPIVFTILQPPDSVPTAMAKWQLNTIQMGMESILPDS